MIVFLTALLLLAVAIAAWAWTESHRWHAAAAEAREELGRHRHQLEEAKERATYAEAEKLRTREVSQVQLKMMADSQRQLEDRFRSLAAEALQSNSQLFLDRSREQVQSVVEPVANTLRQFEEQVRKMELDRAGAYEGLTAQVGTLMQVQERVRQSADDLKNALRSPSQRGRWGELQLRRVVEMAGMLEYCDFAEQKTLFGDTNQRPDLIIRLPNQCQVVVDAKVSLEAYLRGIECGNDAERMRHMGDHARQLKTHVKSLGDKAYWERLPCSPDFVIAFLPLESLFSAALDHDPALLELGVERRVILATPTTLITLLLTVSHGWRQQALSESAEKIRLLGTEMYTRVVTMHDHFIRLGEAVSKTVLTYNQTVASLERNVLSSARKFKELRAPNAKQIEEGEIVTDSPRLPEPSKWIA